MRQNTTSEENAAAVRQFRRATQVLREENVYPQDDVSEFIRDAEVSGVRVEINGELPTEAKLLKVLLAVMRETCINAVRHADATAMYVVSEQTEAAAELREQFPELKIIIVTSMPEESFIKRAKEVGADSFWDKEVSPEELITVMDATMQGKHMWPGETPIVKLGVTTNTDFTETEIKVLRMVCEGLEYSEIAEELHYTKDNVKYHIRNILQKTGYANKTQLAIAVTGKRFIIPKLFDEQDGSEENSIVL